MLYLIAHKVRGEPTFDIAEQMQVGDDIWWIIPTSGHRAYPYWFKEIAKIPSPIEFPGWAQDVLDKMPPELPDHYQATVTIKSKPTSSKVSSFDLDDLLEDL